MKIETNKFAEAILDLELNIVQWNPPFQNLFRKKLDLKSKSLNITQLIRFDQPVYFKTAIENLKKGEKVSRTFYGQITSGKKTKFLQVQIVREKDDPQWSNQMVNLIINETSTHPQNIKDTKAADLEDKEIEKIKNNEGQILQHQKQIQGKLDSQMRELFSNLLLISQKNNLIKHLLKELEKIHSKMDKIETKKDIRRLIGLIREQNVFDDNWENLKFHFVDVHPGFFHTLRNQSTEITERDLRHCAYIKIGLSIKETAQILSVNPKTIEMARYRIKKKLKLEKTEKLTDYLGKL